VVALLLLACVLAGYVGLLPLSLAALALEFGLVDLARGEPARAAPVYGAGLPARGRARLRVTRARPRAGGAAGTVRPLASPGFAGALAVGSLPVAAAGLRWTSGLGAALLGLAAAVTLLGVPVLLVRRRAG
jgi:hypothetical protein